MLVREMLIDGRLLIAGDLIAASPRRAALAPYLDDRALELHLIVEADPRYGRDGQASPYGRLLTIPYCSKDDPTVLPQKVFLTHGTYYLLVIPTHGQEPDMEARMARVPNFDPEG